MLSALLVGNHLSARGRNPTVCEDLAARLRSEGLRVLTTSHRANKTARLVDMLATAWRRRRDYDVAQIDVYSGAAFVWAEAVSATLRSIGKPYVLSLHGGDLPRFAGAFRERVRRVLQPAAAVTAPSAYLARELRVVRDGIEVVPNPVDVDRYQAREPADEPPPRIVWVRAFHQLYGPTTAVEAFAALRKRRPKATMAMYGPDLGDGTLQHARRLARRIPRESLRIGAALPKTALPKVLGRGSIFLNTSIVDNAPVSVVEAMAAGLSIVSSDCGGLPDLLLHKREGLLVPAHDARAFAAAMESILTDPAAGAAYASRARLRARDYAWERVFPRWRSILAAAARS